MLATITAIPMRITRYLPANGLVSVTLLHPKTPPEEVICSAELAKQIPPLLGAPCCVTLVSATDPAGEQRGQITAIERAA